MKPKKIFKNKRKRTNNKENMHPPPRGVFRAMYTLRTFERFVQSVDSAALPMDR